MQPSYELASTEAIDEEGTTAELAELFELAEESVTQRQADSRGFA